LKPNEPEREEQPDWAPDEWLQELPNLRRSLLALGLGQRCTGFFKWYTDRLQRFERFALRDRRRYQRLRIPAVVVAAAVPAVAAADLGAAGRLTAAAMSAFVAAALGVEALLGSGRRWAHFRVISEALKAERYLYVALAGPYSRFIDHQQAFLPFAERVENALQRELDEYSSSVIADLNKRRDSTSSGTNESTAPRLR